MLYVLILTRQKLYFNIHLFRNWKLTLLTVFMVRKNPQLNLSTLFSWEITKELKPEAWNICVQWRAAEGVSWWRENVQFCSWFPILQRLRCTSKRCQKFLPGMFLAEWHIRTAAGSPRPCWIWSTWELGSQTPAAHDHLLDAGRPITYWNYLRQKNPDTRWTKWVCLSMENP